MATGRVWAGFFHTRTRPVGQDRRPRLDQFTKRVFFSGLNLPLSGPTGPVKGLGPIRGPTKKNFFEAQSIKKKKKFPEKQESQQQCNTNNKSK